MGYGRKQGPEILLGETGARVGKNSILGLDFILSFTGSHCGF